ncbi:tRNA guanosine-2'-O-methyltransferase [Piscirickettsia litoralis]|uniref:tRNA (guanosine(18)-2'-O)-methyltransferase n=2 Tax=Piscirickettsia litoralis TaxID=1891921 RepID=A0ABX3A563_9GAMM|nr:tRNA guanosine-2'-O-methyltransferase [Piscirickettsia litoralis]
MSSARLNKIKRVLAARQDNLTVLMDHVHKAHNLSAIARTCDAVGVSHLHAVHPEFEDIGIHHHTASGSKDWVNITRHESISAAYQQLRNQIPNVQILATHLSDKAIDFRQIDYTQPTVIVLGSELKGASSEACEGADQHIIIPMVGMVQSLNVSVAAATILFEAQRQRQLAGMYESAEKQDTIDKNKIFEWMHPKIAKLYQARGQAYPDLDDDGDILPQSR